MAEDKPASEYDLSSEAYETEDERGITTSELGGCLGLLDLESEVEHNDSDNGSEEDPNKTVIDVSEGATDKPSPL